MTLRYRLIESDMNTITKEIGDKRVEVNWMEVENMVGASISPEVKMKYERAFSSRSFKILQFLSLFSKLGNLAHVFFISKFIIQGGLSELSFAIWAGVIAVSCIEYLYKEWFMEHHGLYDLDVSDDNVVVNETDAPKKVNIAKAKDQLNAVWEATNDEDNSRISSAWKWILSFVVIMLSALLCVYVHGVLAEGRYRKQYKRIRRFAEQDAQQQDQQRPSNQQMQQRQQQQTPSPQAILNSKEPPKVDPPKSMPEPVQLLKMSPEESQRAIQEFIKANNITNSKQFAEMFKSAVGADTYRNNHLVRTLAARDPAMFRQAVQAAYAPKEEEKGYLDRFGGSIKRALSPSAVIQTVLMAGMFGGMTGGFSGAFKYLLTFSVPGILAGGIAPMAGTVFMFARMGAQMFGMSANSSGFSKFAGKASGFLANGITVVGVGLLCCCVIRWLYKYFKHPKKAVAQKIVDRAALKKEIGADAMTRAKQQQQQQQRQGQGQNTTNQMQSESYMYETSLYLNEGIVSYIKSKIVGFIKGTYNCLKAILGCGSGSCFRMIIGVLTIGFMLVIGYFGLGSLLGNGG